MKVIGVDPSLTRTGVAIVEDSRVLAWTVIKSEVVDSDAKIEDLARRVYEMGKEFREYIAPHLPAVVCIEGQVAASFGKKMGPATPFKMGVAYGAFLTSTPTPPLVINPSEIRRRLRGKQTVTKEDIIRYGKAHFGSMYPQEPRAKADREAVWDAVAVVLALEPELERLASFVGR